jgi:hypothetical protein
MFEAIKGLEIDSMPSALPHFQRNLIEALLELNIPHKEIEHEVGCTVVMVAQYKQKIRIHGSTDPVKLATRGRLRIVDEEIMVVCPFGDWINCQHLVEYLKAKPFAYRDEMQAFLSKEHGLDLSESTMTCVLEQMKYTRKVVKCCPSSDSYTSQIQHQAQERSQILREDWMVQLSQWKSEQMVFVDESAVNERTADRKWSWALIRMPCIFEQALKRTKKWSVLPAYTVKCFLTWGIQQGSYCHGIMERST